VVVITRRFCGEIQGGHEKTSFEASIANSSPNDSGLQFNRPRRFEMTFLAPTKFSAPSGWSQVQRIDRVRVCVLKNSTRLSNVQIRHSPQEYSRWEALHNPRRSHAVCGDVSNFREVSRTGYEMRNGSPSCKLWFTVTGLLTSRVIPIPGTTAVEMVSLHSIAYQNAARGPEHSLHRVKIWAARNQCLQKKKRLWATGLHNPDSCYFRVVMRDALIAPRYGVVRNV
jgi:hypothetical protein